MLRRTPALPIVLLTAVAALYALAPQETASREPLKTDEPVRAPSPLRTAETPPDTALIGTWTFDGPMGEADPQGWATLDRSPEQPPLFHVDDFAGLVFPLAPLDGAKSLWCGSRDGECSWATPPGIGDSWNQMLTSIPFATTGDVTVEFLIYSDTEASYDETYVQYLTKDGHWRTLDYYDHDRPPSQPSLESLVIPGDSLAGSVRVRFFFQSDGSWSDVDGFIDANGVLLDNLRIADGTGILDEQTFEAESVGATATADGHWTTTGLSPFGNYAALFDGTTVLQEDTLSYNDTHFWGFFNGSSATYACDGHPEQAAIPPPVQIITSQTGNDPDFPQYSATINNVARSPAISLVEDVYGQPVPWAAQTLLLSFDLYFEAGDCAGAITWVSEAEFLIDGCWKSRGSFNLFDFQPPQQNKRWSRGTASVMNIPDEASYVRLSLGVVEFYPPIFPCACRSHWPLIDNVELSAITEFVAGASPAPAAAHLEQNIPNPFNPGTTIRYTLSSPGAVSLRVYDVRGRLVRTLVDAVQKPGDGAMAIEWDGRDDAGSPVASGIYLYRLVAPGIDETRKAVLLK